MPRVLTKIPFVEEHLRVTAHFSCGSEEWEREVADWIRERDGVLDTMQRFKSTRVWLYATEEDGLVGFSSLGTSKWALEPGSERIRLSIIPWVGIQQRFWGQPDGEGERRFSDQILDHLLYEARLQDAEPYLGLFVDRRNVRAIRVYERAGFREVPGLTQTNERTGAVYQGYVLKLSGA